MTLHYEFEVFAEGLCSVADHVNAGWYEPHYQSGMAEVGFDYEVEPTDDDYITYLMRPIPSDFGSSKAMRKAYLAGAKAMLDALYEDYGVREALEEDKGFAEFMEERYRDEAEDECRRQYS